MGLAAVTLDDKYTLERGRVFLTGTQALVRLPMMQRQRDRTAGLNTASFISGYRGSPLGALDQQLWSARRFLDRSDIHFQPGVNEDLAATSIWGSQQVGLAGDAKVDGVFALWYGKGPGVDRSGDVFKHGNMAGSAAHGGVLLLAGDDHTCKSSTTAHQSEYAFMDAMIPVLSPAGVQEFLDLGLFGWAMSRYSGCWIAMKAIAETVETSASVEVAPERVQPVLPTDFEMPESGLNIRWPDAPLDQELRLHKWKLYAALAFARANRLDHAVIDSPHRKLGIVTHGKSYLDVRQALDDLGISEAMAEDIGLSVYKVAMTWPLEREGIRNFAEGLDEILVVEEKRAVIENQLKEQLYNWREDVRPRVIGKFDEAGSWVLPSNGELTPARVARVIAERLRRYHRSDAIDRRLAFLEEKEQSLADMEKLAERMPFFCSGCPHNTSTKVPEGSRALAGIGCHYMALWMDRNTDTFSQMGGEGAAWIGQAPFVTTEHVFANIGDGTYFHSGILAIRAAVAAGRNITYKLLFNDAVAMTGGQHHDGPLTVPQITRQVAAEGVARVVVVSDEPDKYPLGSDFAPGVTFHHRDDLDSVQRDLRDQAGVTVLVYDQTCAAEKRRRRKRGTFPDPDKRVVINELVCEGCGDCSVQSNCLSVVPVDTEFGRKRAIDQSSCNKDFSCLKGFCPSFVTVHGGTLRKPEKADPGDRLRDLPEPDLPVLDDNPYGIVVTGIGGTGVVTIGALLGMAAHLEGKGCSILDMAGLAQKGGAVVSHVRIARKPEDIHAVSVAAGGARLVMGCDMVVTGAPATLAKMAPDATHVVVNGHETVTAAFTRDPDFSLPTRGLRRAIEQAVGGPERLDWFDASKLATALMGDSIYTNPFVLGFAYQKGLVPVSGEAIVRAIELNGRAVAANRRAFAWGRLAAVDMRAVEAVAEPNLGPLAPRDIAGDLDEIIARRVRFLTDYQDAAYARRYADLVDRARQAERTATPGQIGFADAVARYGFKLMAVKDEYEVARLYTDGSFRRQLAEQFEGDYRLEFHLAPPILGDRDPATGHLRKRAFGPWMMTAFRAVAALRRLRGTRWDPFGRTEERRMERQLSADYHAVIEELAIGLTADNHALAVEIAGLPDDIRGYGHVKDRNVARVLARQQTLLHSWRNPDARPQAAE